MVISTRDLAHSQLILHSELIIIKHKTLCPDKIRHRGMCALDFGMYTTGTLIQIEICVSFVHQFLHEIHYFGQSYASLYHHGKHMEPTG